MIANLEHALNLATLYRGFCAPNPAVGAVLVKDQQLISTGVHRGCGLPHAEVEALSKTSTELLKNSTLYVTLEPCCHFGKTPPCTDRIIKSGIKKVIYAYRDPNPLVSGKGQAALISAGIHCELFNLSAIDLFYKSYYHWFHTKKPWVTAKCALTIDGKIAGKNGKTVAISHPDLKALTYQGRLHADAILTSVRTVIADDPQLNIRHQSSLIAKPVYVIDHDLSLPENTQLIKTAKPLIILHAENADPKKQMALKNKGIILQVIPFDAKNRANLNKLLHYLGEQGIHDLWVEAGGKLTTALLAENLIQDLILYVAPMVLGETAIPAFLQKELLQAAKKMTWQAYGRDSVCRLSF